MEKDKYLDTVQATSGSDGSRLQAHALDPQCLAVHDPHLRRLAMRQEQDTGSKNCRKIIAWLPSVVAGLADGGFRRSRNPQDNDPANQTDRLTEASVARLGDDAKIRPQRLPTVRVLRGRPLVGYCLAG